ncbi:MAG: FlgO family outer membrane protein, partial [Pseudomonadota bacterium]|nr:FlgO family outer membrane protein [Pseudomonadota bacterium]
MTAIPAESDDTTDTENRGAAASSGGTEGILIADWRVEPALLRITHHGDSLKLEPKVMAVLVYLARRPGQVVTREELEDSVWAGAIVSYDALTGAIQKLRKAFNDDPRRPRIIETLSKKGYRLVAPVQPLDAQAGVNPSATAAIPVKGHRPWAIISILLLLLLLATAVYFQSMKQTDDAVMDAGAVPGPSIAVLPFDNLDRNPEQNYFADGITDDLITGLAKYPELLVISRDSTFLYKDKQLDAMQIADRLNVRYILHGSVRRDNQQVRINARLVDTRNSSLLWAETYDGTMQDIFKLQDTITHSIIAALAVKLSTPGAALSAEQAGEDPQAYDSLLLGRQHFYLFARHEENNRAREFFRSAIEYDTHYAQAYAMLAWTHVYDVMNGWSEDR